MKHCMLDLETVSVEPNAAIIAIGAVQFDPFEEGAIGTKFYSPISIQSCVDAGLHISGETLDWWQRQSNEAKKVLVDATKPDAPTLDSVLVDFSRWFREHSLEYVWGNGSDFDNVILNSAYNALNLSSPWGPFNNRCYRTIKSLAPEIEIERMGTYHNALDDAISQAKHLQRILGGSDD